MAKEKKQFTDYFTDFAQKWVPDSYVIALVLTIVAFILALLFTSSGPLDTVIAWGNGFCTFLKRIEASELCKRAVFPESEGFYS